MKVLAIKNIKYIIAAVVALLLVGGGIAYAVVSQQPAKSGELVKVSPVVQTIEENGVLVNVQCEGWNADTSTPIVIAVYEGDVKDTLLSTDENVEVPDPINEISLKAGEDTKLEDITETGTYTLSIV